MGNETDLLEQLETLAKQAEELGRWLCITDIWLSPSEARKLWQTGRFLWGEQNWKIDDPQKELIRLMEEVLDAENKLEQFQQRLQIQQIPICECGHSLDNHDLNTREAIVCFGLGDGERDIPCGCGGFSQRNKSKKKSEIPNMVTVELTRTEIVAFLSPQTRLDMILAERLKRALSLAVGIPVSA